MYKVHVYKYENFACMLKTFFYARLCTQIYLITIALDVSFKLSNMIENVKSYIESSFHWYVEF